MHILSILDYWRQECPCSKRSEASRNRRKCGNLAFHVYYTVARFDLSVEIWRIGRFLLCFTLQVQLEQIPDETNAIFAMIGKCNTGKVVEIDIL